MIRSKLRGNGPSQQVPARCFHIYPDRCLRELRRSAAWVTRSISHRLTRFWRSSGRITASSHPDVFPSRDVIRIPILFDTPRWNVFPTIVWDVKSDYPAKEVLTPIQQTIFYFTEDEYRASKVAAKPILLLARPCDINAQKIQARIYAGNGGYDDFYYTRMRELVTFALMECGGGDDTCFCVSMGTNRTDDYAIALRFSPEGVVVGVEDESFAPYFDGMPQEDYTPAFGDGK